MIRTIELRNFQSHKNTLLNLHPGVNIITGSSDSGKSSIIRALKWVIWNRPLGDDFRSHWGGDTYARINDIIRFKGKYDAYRINDLELKAFGTHVPEEITKTLNIAEINLQSQADPHFLLSQNAGEVARHFNVMAGIAQIDHSTKKIKSQIHAINQTIRATEMIIIENEEKLKKYKQLDKAEIELEILESLSEKHVNTIKSRARIQKTISDIYAVKIEIENQSSILTAENDVNTILSLIHHKETIETAYNILTRLRSDINTQNELIEENQEIIKAEDDTNILFQFLCDHEKKADELISLTDTITNIQKSTKKINHQKMKIIDLEKMFHKYFPDTCPLCGHKN